MGAHAGLGGDNEQLQGPRLYEALLQAALLQQGKPRQLKALHAEIYGAAASNLAGLLPASQAHEAAQLYSTALFSHDDQANDALVWGRLGVCAARCRSLGLARFALEQAIRRARDHIPLQEHAMEVRLHVQDDSTYTALDSKSISGIKHEYLRCRKVT